MKRSFLICLIFLVLPTSPVLGQTSELLKMVPEDYDGFLLINRLSQTDKAIARLQTKGETFLPQVLPYLKKTLGTTKGLRLDGSFASVAVRGKRSGGDITILPATDYSLLLKGLKLQGDKGPITKFQTLQNKSFLIARRGSFALMTPASYRAGLEKLLREEKGIASGNKKLHQWFAKNDASFVMSSSFLDKTSKGFRELLTFLKGTKREPDQSPASLDGAIRALKHMEENVTFAAFGGRLQTKDHLHMNLWAGFKQDCLFAKEGKHLQTFKTEPFAGLPEGPFVLAVSSAFRGDFRAFAWSVLEEDLLKNRQKTPKQQRAKAKMTLLLEELFRCKAIHAALYLPNKESACKGGLLFSMRVDNATNYLSTFEKNLQHMRKLSQQLPAADQFPPLTVRCQSVEQFFVLEMSAPVEVDLKANKKKAWKYLFGYEGKGPFHITVAALDEHLVLISFTPAKELAPLLQSYRNKTGSLAKQKEVAPAIAKLDPNAHWLGLVSPHRFVEWNNRYLSQFSEIRQLQELPDSEPASFSIRIAPHGLLADLHMPYTAIDLANDLNK